MGKKKASVFDLCDFCASIGADGWIEAIANEKGRAILQSLFPGQPPIDWQRLQKAPRGWMAVGLHVGKMIAAAPGHNLATVHNTEDDVERLAVSLHAAGAEVIIHDEEGYRQIVGTLH